MLYFTLWAIFLLVVLLAVPTAALIEKRRYRIDNPSENAEVEEPSDEDGSEEVGEAGDLELPLEEVAEFAEIEGGDDFPEFDEID